MKPSPLTYHRPATLDEALDLLSRLGADAKVLAGGQSLVPLLSMRLMAPPHLVDIGRLPGLSSVDVGTDAVRVGALVTHAALERHEGAAAAQPLLRRALALVAHPTIRNRGTTVGSIVHADPSAEMPAVLTLLEGSVQVTSVRGSRTVAAADLFAGPLETTLAPDELAVGATFPRCDEATGTAIAEVARRHGDYAVAGVVAAVSTGAGGAPVRATAAYVSAGEPGVLVHLPVDDRAGWEQRAAAHAAATVATEADIHASAAYRSHLVQVLTARALTEALAAVAPGTVTPGTVTPGTVGRGGLRAAG
jgi:carbon-monoxide dehydrogenase medium subunit